MNNNASSSPSVMMEDKETTVQSLPPTYTPQAFPPSVRRKPVPNTTTASAPSFTKDRYAQSTPTKTGYAFPTRMQTWWSHLQRRNKIIVLASIVALIILIIGLAAGLSTRHHKQNLPLPSSHGGPYTGDLTYYDPGLGACGITSKSSDGIVAVSHLLFDAVSTSSDPNSNPLCGKKIRARRNDVSRDVVVVDRCTGCQARDLDVTRSVFADLADIDQGRVTVEWAWLEDVPGSSAGS